MLLRLARVEFLSQLGEASFNRLPQILSSLKGQLRLQPYLAIPGHDKASTLTLIRMGLNDPLSIRTSRVCAQMPFAEAVSLNSLSRNLVSPPSWTTGTLRMAALHRCWYFLREPT